MTRVATAIAVLSLILVSCGGSPAATPVGTPAVTVELAATNSVFDKSSLSVPANVTYAIHFQNNDTVPHNVSVQNAPAGSTGEIFGGPGARTYVFPALGAGTYTFRCDVHPEMAGTITAN